jgi:macrolide-specific efflux system membrane fusion protein
MKASFLKRWRVRLIVIAMLLAAAASWWFTRTPPAPPAPPSGIVALADVTQSVQAAGVLQAKTRVDRSAARSRRCMSSSASRSRRANCWSALTQS